MPTVEVFVSSLYILFITIYALDSTHKTGLKNNVQYSSSRFLSDIKNQIKSTAFELSSLNPR